MRQVHYSRISSSSSSPRLFIRDFPVIEFLILVIVLFSVSADAEVTPPIEEGSIINSTGLFLRTCCPFQSQYNAEYDRCTDLSEKGNDLPHETFPGTFAVPDHLISRVYRNSTYDKKFRYFTLIKWFFFWMLCKVFSQDNKLLLSAASFLAFLFYFNMFSGSWSIFLVV